MKVLHVHTESGWGGGEKQLMQLIDGLNSEGVQSSLFCHRHSELANRCADNSIPHVTSTSTSVFGFGYYKLFRLIRHTAPDIIHAHTSKAHTIVIILSLFIRTRPLIVTRRMNNPVKNNFLGKFKYTNKRIKKIICVSEAVQKTLSAAVNAEKLVWIYGGIAIEKTRHQINRSFLSDRYPMLKGKKVAGFVGSFTDVKDPLLFIDTAKKLLSEKPDLMFVMIGDGELRLDVDELIKEYDLSSSFLFTGFLEEMIPAISSLDLLLVTSKNEGIPNAILEAFACEVPVVSVNVGGITELIDHEQTGLLAERSALGLATCSQRLLEDNVLRKRLIDGASRKLGLFDYRIGIRKTAGLYQELLGKK